MGLFEFTAQITWLPGLLFFFGFLFVGFEIFYPGFGFFGISGLILLVLGIVFTAKTFLDAIIMIIILLIVLVAALFIFVKFASKGRITRRIILPDKLDSKSGFDSTKNQKELIGMEGISLSILRPSGTAQFNDGKYDVVSQGEFIAKGTNIKIIDVEGRRIIVGKI